MFPRRMGRSPRPYLARGRPEELDCVAFMDTLRIVPGLREVASLIFHIPNEREKTVTRLLLRAMGVRAGVADYFLPMPAHGFHGLFLEVKHRPLDRLTPPQARFLWEVQRKGYMAARATGSEGARRAVDFYLRRPYVRDLDLDLDAGHDAPLVFMGGGEFAVHRLAEEAP